MGDSEAAIPVIDFSAYKLSLTKPDTTQFQKLVDDVHKALTTIGFFFMINTDFQHSKVQEQFKISKSFFDLPVELKRDPSCTKADSSGYACVGRETLNPDRPHGGIKESFNLNSGTTAEHWPSESSCPGFKTTFQEFLDLCIPLHDRVLEVMAYGLKLEDPQLFVKFHAAPYAHGLRTLWYPSLNDVTPKEQQVRCGEHSDYGGITMLFQQKPGLEVRKRDGCYVKVPMVEDGILVNIGDLMQRWTADIYIAAKHRVLMDETPEERGQTRQSIAFFGHPSSDAPIECIDGSNKYPPIYNKEYMALKYSVTY